MKSKLKVILTVLIIALIIFLIRYFGLVNYMGLENIIKVQQLIEKIGLWAPLIYLLLYILVCLFFLPRVTITLVGGLVFGPVWGTIWSSLGTTLGAMASFIVSRYLARDMVKKKFGSNQHFKRIEHGFNQYGKKMLIISRIVPVVPFSVQNYLYGLTSIKLRDYILITWFCMLPSTVVYCFAAGSIVEGTTNIESTLLYLGIAGMVFVLILLLSKFIEKKQQDVFLDK